MARLPVALANDTIVECVCEIRFSTGHPSVEDLLPGLVFGKLTRLFTTVIPMPAGQVPKAVREVNEQMRYLPTQALQGPDMRMLFGPHTVAVSFSRPYRGWAKVKPLILECMTTVIDTQLIGRPERVAIKYVNLLQHGRNDFDLAQTSVKLELGEFPINGPGTIVRAEVNRNGCTSIVEIASGAKIMTSPGHELTGVLLSVDTLKSAPEGDLGTMLPQVLESVHETEKEIFFGLIAPETLEKLGPIYQTKH